MRVARLALVTGLRHLDLALIFPAGRRTAKQRSLRRQAVLACSLLAMTAGAARAAQLPLWELGFGVAPLSIPDYRGSDQQRTYILPLPYLIYRGKVLTIDRHGVMGKVLKSDRLRIDFSVNAGVPVKSSQNDARAGMPDLYPTIEVGPLLEVCLDPVCDGEPTWTFRLPARAVIATDLHHTRYIGWTFNPNINYDKRLRIGAVRWNFGAALGPVFATDQQNDYYYSVDPAYATATRPAYEARAGYGGMRFAVALSKRFKNTWVGAFVRYDNLSGAVFEDSPLVRTHNSVMAGFGVAWVFAHSSTMVDGQP